MRTEQDSRAVLAAIRDDSSERPGVYGLILRIPEFIFDSAGGAVVLPDQTPHLGAILVAVGDAGQPEQQADRDQRESTIFLREHRKQ
ncbi:MAG: hypothetical protein ACR2NM_16980 [Bythopirellula sp.]